MKKILLFIVSVLVIASGIYMLANEKNIETLNFVVPSFVPQKSSQEVLSVDQLKGDLGYIVTKLKKVHPNAYEGFSEEQKAVIDAAYEKIKGPMKVGDFFFIANEIVSSFKDGHTRLNIQVTERDNIINIPMVWLKDGLYVEADSSPLYKGDKVVSIGGMEEKKLLEEMRKVIPAENDYFVKVLAPNNIIKENFLRYLNLVEEDSVLVKVKRGEGVFEYKIPIEKVGDAFSNNGEKPWVRYSIEKENSLGIFILDK